MGRQPRHRPGGPQPVGQETLAGTSRAAQTRRKRSSCGRSADVYSPSKRVSGQLPVSRSARRSAVAGHEIAIPPSCWTGIPSRRLFRCCIYLAQFTLQQLAAGIFRQAFSENHTFRYFEVSDAASAMVDDVSFVEQTTWFSDDDSCHCFNSKGVR